MIFPKVLDARIFGRGKEDLDKYDDKLGGIAAYKKYTNIFASLNDEKEEYEPYTEDIEEKSIPLDIIKQAEDYVQSKYIFDLNDRKRTR